MGDLFERSHRFTRLACPNCLFHRWWIVDWAWYDRRGPNRGQLLQISCTTDGPEPPEQIPQTPAFQTILLPSGRQISILHVLPTRPTPRRASCLEMPILPLIIIDKLVIQTDMERNRDKQSLLLEFDLPDLLNQLIVVSSVVFIRLDAEVFL